jgi:hypothetical protein
LPIKNNILGGEGRGSVGGGNVFHLRVVAGAIGI